MNNLNLMQAMTLAFQKLPGSFTHTKNTYGHDIKLHVSNQDFYFAFDNNEKLTGAHEIQS